MNKIEIPFRLPSLNQYINECRKNKYAGANMKKTVDRDIGYYINKLPQYKNPIKIHFTWVEENKRRDLDNVCFAKKFILDSMVKAGKLKDDNRNYVVGFEDNFKYDKASKVILEIEEVKNEIPKNNTNSRNNASNTNIRRTTRNNNIKK